MKELVSVEGLLLLQNAGAGTRYARGRLPCRGLLYPPLGLFSANMAHLAIADIIDPATHLMVMVLRYFTFVS